MRRIFVFIMCSVMLISLFGCAREQDAPLPEPDIAGGSMRKTVLYYATDDGLIIPVVREIAWDEGIACSALSYLVAGDDNEREVRLHGLRAVIPDGTSFSLTIGDDKRAVLDVQNMPSLPDADTEMVFLQTVVNTLTEFETIDRVSITFDGKYTAQMPHGTHINRDMNSFMLNPVNTETETISQGSISTVSLYIPDRVCNYIIPVTGYVTGESSFESAMGLFCESCDIAGPALPDGTRLVSAEIGEGSAIVNFTDEFAGITSENDGVLQAVYNAIYLTALEYGDVTELKLCAGARPIDTDAVPVSAPLYVNEWR